MSSSGSREPSLTHTTLLLPHSPWEEEGGGGRGEEEGGGRRGEGGGGRRGEGGGGREEGGGRRGEEGGGEVFSHGL